MNFVQTFWTGNTRPNNPLALTGGWLAPEFHWMAWALSCLQLQKYHGAVILSTDHVGKGVLIDTLHLPYAQVDISLEKRLAGYSDKLWALAKIYTYNQQREPFLHVDGDIFIWEPFPDRLLQAESVAQNIECNFPFYHESLEIVKGSFRNVPLSMQKALQMDGPLYSCNTGLIGGHRLSLFQEYTKAAFQLIDYNLDNLLLADVSKFNICFEQFLYFALLNDMDVPCEYYISPEIPFDPAYPGFADFHDVPHRVKFIHAMHDYKRNPDVCRHLAMRLRRDYPYYYYHILSVCKQNNTSLHYQIYSLPLLVKKLPNLPQSFTDQSVELVDDASWYGRYLAQQEQYKIVEAFLAKSWSTQLATPLTWAPGVFLEESDTPVLRQWLHFSDVMNMTTQTEELDAFTMILLDSFQTLNTVAGASEEIVLYMSTMVTDLQALQELVFTKVQHYLYKGVLCFYQADHKLMPEMHSTSLMNV